MKPLILITAGDPLGIGPEITVKALQNPRVQRACRPVVIGEPASLKKAGFTPRLAQLLAVESPQKQPRGHAPSAWGGALSFQAVHLGIKIALQTGAPLITAPISKQSWALAGISFPGHTELLRQETHRDGLMMFISGNLRCALVTEHAALAHLPLTKERVTKSTLHFVQALKQTGIKNPFIGLCAVNPHAGDNGLFGTEEKQILQPAVTRLRRLGIRVEGPLPTDTAWMRHQQGQYDGLLCMYHDQALLGLKLAAKEPIVHLTAGLPFLRTSPAHGTAFDIAGKNKADEQSMLSAILFTLSKKH